MEKRELEILLKKLAEGKLLPKEAARLQEALDQELLQQHGHFYKPEIWKDALNGPSPDSGERERANLNFEAVFRQIRQQQETIVIPMQNRRWWHSARLRAACLAGVIVICGVAGGYWSYKKLNSPTTEPAIAWNQINTSLGERNRLTLGDGTVIYINGGTSLKYPEVFTGEKREVELISGEIFLEVAPNEAVPFLVKTDSLSVKVLGTSFSVINRPENGKVSVAVKTGRVSFGANSRTKALLLNSGREGVFHKNGGDLKEEAVNKDAIAGWARDEFIFEDATLAEVLTALENSYGYRYRIENKAAENRIFRASFNQHTPQQIIHALSMLGDFKYVIRDSTIIVK